MASFVSLNLLLFWGGTMITTASSSIKLRVVTWNVADNGQMGGQFTDEAIDKVLGLTDSKADKLPSVYAIGLQENCWMCNSNNWKYISDRFLNRIKEKSLDGYSVVGIQGTRKSWLCEVSCMTNSHGTVILLVIAKKSLGTNNIPIRHNKGCSANRIPNKEKGVAAMKYIMDKNGKSLCFGAAHLDSANPKYRRDCLNNFLNTADSKVSWTKTCDFQFIFGDFNTRTGDKSKEKGAEYLSKSTNMKELKKNDELIGSDPYGSEPNLKQNLLVYLNSVRSVKYQEGPLNFMPTYSIKPSKKFCDGKIPCYRKDRPKSWTDRIIFTNGKCDKYDAIYEEYGDHFPVFAEYTLHV